MEKISFVKMTGAGNDFIVINKNENPNLVLNPTVIQRLCNRYFGIGADGLITMEASSDFDFLMNYYNADGSTGSLCGNGARCALKFAEQNNMLKNYEAKFVSNGDVYTGEISNEGRIKFNFNSPKNSKFNIKVLAASQSINADYIDTGSPHVVVSINNIVKDTKTANSFYSNIDEVPVFDLGKEIRYNMDFSPEGTNVNFIQIEEKKIFIRTYERGVENETLACGTGSVAAALIAFYKHALKPPITLVTKGGKELIVDFTAENGTVDNVSLTGPAEVIFEGKFQLNKFI